MLDPGTPFFSPVQRKLVGTAVALAAFLAIVALLVLVVVVLSRILGTFSHVIGPLAVAGILALMLRPVVGLFERRLHLSRGASVLVLYALVIVVCTGLLLVLVPKVFGQIVEFANGAPDIWNRASASIREHYPNWIDLYNRAMQNDTLRKLIEGATEQGQHLAMAILPNLKAAGGTVFGLAGVVTNIAIIPVYLFFFLQSDEDPSSKLHEFLPFLKDETREDVVFLVRNFLSIVVAFFRGQLLIGLIMGVLLAFGFWLAGLQFGVLFGLMAGFLNTIPYLGTMLGLSTVLPTAYFQADGGGLTLGLCLGVFVLVQVIEGYVLTPRIMGRQTGLHPVAIIIAIFFWGIALDGILGMVLAIPLTAFLVTAWRLAKRKYFRQVV